MSPDVKPSVVDRSPPVLLYHGFGHRDASADPEGLFVPSEVLERHLRVFATRFRPLGLTEYLHGFATGSWPRRSVLLTIDDGFVSTLTVAAPLLARYAVPAVLFVPAGCIGGKAHWTEALSKEQLLSASQLRELDAYGVEVGVHGLDHARLRGLSTEQLWPHVEGARDQLAHVIGYSPRAFAYPYGEWDVTAEGAVQQSGYSAAFSVDQGGHTLHALPRRCLDPDDTRFMAALKASRTYHLAVEGSRRLPRSRKVAVAALRRAGVISQIDVHGRR